VQLSWSTFLLEIINFLILVWILKRFLYKPVLAAIASRKAAVDKTLSDAKAKHLEAEKLEQEYQNRLADWEKEKAGLREALNDELRAQREKLTADLRKALDEEREKERVLAERRLAELQDRAADEGIAQGVQFTTRLLQRIASADLEARLVKLAIEDLPHLPASQLQLLKDACGDRQRAVKIASAFPLADAQRSQVIQILNEVAQQTVTPTFQQDPSLTAGVRISAGPWTVRANLKDELQFFAEMAQHDIRQH
jgi:F-type H+-transporting ATPase subunit b